MKFGFTCVVNRLEDVAQLARALDEGGFDRMGLGDSQSLYQELYVTCTLAVLNSKRLKVGPSVTNPLTRHPAVTASAIASVDDLSGGRAFLGVGSGDSAVLVMGMPPARLNTLREYVICVRRLFADGAAPYQGATARLTWAKRRVPLYVGAAGPKTLRLAGEVADGAQIASGFESHVAAASRQAVLDGARSAGRRPEDVDIWWTAPAALGATYQGAVRHVRVAIAARANNSLGGDPDEKRVPPQHRDAVRRLRELYAMQDHVRPGGRNEGLTDELGLTDYLVDRFAIAGTPEQCVEKVLGLKEMGVTQLWLNVNYADRLGFVRTWAEKVMPKVG